MAECPIKNCKWKGKKGGLPVHLARIHHLRKSYDVETQVCPIPWCGMVVPDLLRHFEELHEDWRLSSGKFVFEVV
jgi:hypothetical protein